MHSITGGQALQGGPSGWIAGLGWLSFWQFHLLPSSAWADGKLAELAEQVDKLVEHHMCESTHPKYPTRGDTLYKYTCTSILHACLPGLLYALLFWRSKVSHMIREQTFSRQPQTFARSKYCDDVKLIGKLISVNVEIEFAAIDPMRTRWTTPPPWTNPPPP